MTLDPSIQFREPGPVRPPREGETDWTAVVETLKQHKGEWALVGEYSQGVASHIRSGRYQQFHPHGSERDKAALYMERHWEVTLRKERDDQTGVRSLYIRWLG